jgi:2-methylcitrate dehydratase PrpD
MKKITVALDPELDATFPAQRAARVSIQLANGKSEEFLQPTRKGDPDMPLSDTELEEKFLELAAPVLGDGAARSLLGRLWRLETQSTLV